jgi:hypothetical protein
MENNINSMYIIKKNIIYLESNYKKECSYITYDKSSNTFEEKNVFDTTIKNPIDLLYEVYMLENNKIYHKPTIEITFTNKLRRILVFDTNTLLDDFIKQLGNASHYIIYK